MTDPITHLNAALEGRYRVEREKHGELGLPTTAPFTLDDLIKSVPKDSPYRVGRGVTLSKTTGAVRAMVAAGRVSR